MITFPPSQQSRIPNSQLLPVRQRTASSSKNLIIQVHEVSDVLSMLKVNTARGPDGMGHRMLEETSKTVAVPLAKLFIIQSHTFPDMWKIVHIMPTLKKWRMGDGGTEMGVGNHL